MIAFNGMLVPAAEAAGIKVPPDPDLYYPAEYPHWHVYCMSQIGAPMPHPHAHFDNAKVIAKFTEDAIMKVTFPELEEAGCVWGNSYFMNG